MNAYVKSATPVEIVAILDRSGSMSAIWHDAIGGFNTFLKKQQEEPGEALMTMVLFDDHYEVPVKATPLKDVLPLTDQTYVPRGMTALNDAIGRSLSELFSRNPERAIVVVLTDGQENASREYTSDKVKDLIKQAQDKNYQVVYLAANQDAFAVGGSLGVARSATKNFVATGAGVRTAYSTASLSTSNYRAGGTGEVTPEQ